MDQQCSGNKSGKKDSHSIKSNATSKRDTVKSTDKNGKVKKRNKFENGEHPGSFKLPKRAAACSNFKEKCIRLSDESSIIEIKQDRLVEEEIIAVRLTGIIEEDPRPTRKITDFILHDSDGVSKPFEMSEVDDLYISALVMPLDDHLSRDVEKSIRCQGFGRIESWAISGYEEGFPVIWISTEIADYECVKPASNYKSYYDHFFEKARACIEIFKKLSKSHGGNPDLSLDELLAGVVRAISGSKNFPSGAPGKDFLLSLGEFVYNQLIGLDETSNQNDQIFDSLPVLVALREECRRRKDTHNFPLNISNGSLKINGNDESDGTISQYFTEVENEDEKLARLLQEEEDWKLMKQSKARGTASSSNKFYIKINEDEIANDYPMPAYYSSSVHEMDEYVFFDNDIDIYSPDDLPRSMLHNWSLYNSDSRLVSLELLPMKPGAVVDVTIFGSGLMTTDDGSGFCMETDPVHSSSGVSNEDGVPIYLSAIKEWMIEFGSSMIFISVRTDMAWYRLGTPSKQYAPWYAPVLKTARLAVSIITLLKEQSRASKLSFVDVIKKVSEFDKSHPAYISSIPAAVERYIVVHGQIILQQFAEYPDDTIRKCAFISGLSVKMEERHHTKLLMKKKVILQKKQANLNPRAGMEPTVSKRKAMQATTTRLINRIWGEYYSNYLPEDSNNVSDGDQNDDGDDQEQNEEENVEEDTIVVQEEAKEPLIVGKSIKLKTVDKNGMEWDGNSMGVTESGEPLYKQAKVRGSFIAVGGSVLLLSEESDEMPLIVYIEYMFERCGVKMAHGRVMERGSRTVLGNAANGREVFLTNECKEFKLEEIKDTVSVDIRLRPWGHQYRKENARKDKADRSKAEEMLKNGLCNEYYCKSLYWPQKGAFFKLPLDTMGQGTGLCEPCNFKQLQQEKFEIDSEKKVFTYRSNQYAIYDFVYIGPEHFATTMEEEQGTFKAGRNVGLKAYVICQLLELEMPKAMIKATPLSTMIKLRRFYRPEDISSDKAYSSDIREVYYSEKIVTLPVDTVEGKCQIRKKHDLPCVDGPSVFDHIFFCEYFYDPVKGSLKQLPASVRLKFSTGNSISKAILKKKGKCKEGENESDEHIMHDCHLQESRLNTLDIFAGCGGLSAGLQQAGASITKWAIEYEQPAGDAFNLNHPEALTFIDNCNVILRAIMEKCGDTDDCISTSEANELAAKLSEKDINNLPLPGQVDFINGGPPCQGFSGMNRFNQSTWSKVQCEMILAFLSFADYFRPRFFLLENVRNFISFNKGQTFRLTIASLLEMGYQVRFGILEAGAYGVSQSRKRAFIWAASPEELLPEWPEPMHVFASPELKISLPGNVQYAAVRSTARGAPFRSMTVRDTIGDLPPVENGASKIEIDYGKEPVSWFQKQIRGDMAVLHDHISKEMNELNLIRCKRIPKQPGADWHDLPDEKVKLSTGQVVDLIPWCLPNTADRHNQWKGLYGRLDWEGNFPTSITDPQPMGKVGMCFHPDQDRILTVRECARSQGFQDRYLFSGNIQSKHRQIGNAVPPPLAFALGRRLKEVLDSKNPLTSNGIIN